MTSSPRYSVNRYDLNFKVVVLGLILLADLIWLATTSMTLDFASAAVPFVFIIPFVIIGLFYRIVRRNGRIETIFNEFAIAITFTCVGTIFSYLITTSQAPLYDEYVIMADQMIGFDWFSYFQVFNTNELLATLAFYIYKIGIYQIFALIVFLPMINKAYRVSQYNTGLIIAALIGFAISGLTPTAGAAGHFALDPSLYVHVKPMVDFNYMEHFFKLRSGEMTHINMENARGLISFPSYHAAAAVLTIIACRKIPYLFTPILCLNICVLLVTPVEGGHHLFDVLGGIVIALVSAWLALKLPKILETIWMHYTSRNSQAVNAPAE